MVGAWRIMAAVALAASMGLSACGRTSTGTADTHTKGQDHMSPTGTEAPEADAQSIYAFTMDRIDGTPESLADYKGKVVIVVNVASKCGLTPQYAALEKLYEQKKDDGLVILGFPANNFMGQEPGSNDQIQQFCTTEYGVTFPMFAKISVKGDDQAPLYTMLSTNSEEPSWNFTKYLIGKDGTLVRRFGPRTSPDDAEFVAEIDRLLASG